LALAKKIEEEEDHQAALDAVAQEEKVEEKKPEGESISSYVKQNVVEQLMAMGFTKNASEKALFMNQK